MKFGILLGAAFFVLGVMLALVQLWFAPWSAELFVKLEMTIGALCLVVVVVWFVFTEYKETKINRSGDHLDG